MNKILIEILNNISKILLIKGEIAFKAQAYKTAADIIEIQNLDVKNLLEQGKLAEVEGFGKALVEKITDFVTNGEMQYYNKLKQEVPISLLDLLEIEGLGIKRISKLWKELNVISLNDLKEVIDNDKINEIDGFGKKLIENLKKNLHNNLHNNLKQI